MPQRSIEERRAAIQAQLAALDEKENKQTQTELQKAQTKLATLKVRERTVAGQILEVENHIAKLRGDDAAVTTFTSTSNDEV